MKFGRWVQRNWRYIKYCCLAFMVHLSLHAILPEDSNNQMWRVFNSLEQSVAFAVLLKMRNA